MISRSINGWIGHLPLTSSDSVLLQLTADAIIDRVVLLVDESILVHGLPEFLRGCLMFGICRAHEVDIRRHTEQAHQFLYLAAFSSTNACGVTPFDWAERYILMPCSSVPVVEKYLISHELLVAGNRIGAHELNGMSDMRIAVHVWQSGRYVKRLHGSCFLILEHVNKCTGRRAFLPHLTTTSALIRLWHRLRSLKRFKLIFRHCS